ncbi:tartrate dehydrogenase [Virgibacillus byunsanensis]|uniref:D-malate dehydrogenase (decarboxylating) n=1 Tax=Virgibacillus byunsanensis TaxID=570945 RepID=A0ABW3LGE0_9BACI
MKQWNIAVIPGDGIGKEVVPEALRVLDTAASIQGNVTFNYTEFPWGSDYYVEHGMMMPEDGMDQLKQFDAIFLGAVGDPNLVPDHISLWGLLLKIRRDFQQSINIRPAKYFEGLKTPLADPNNFDLIVVRENSEGEYSEVGGRIHKGEDQIAIQNAIFTRKGTENVMRYAFELSKTRTGHLTSATKSNGIFHTMPFWDEVFSDIKQEYGTVETKKWHIDALAALLVTRPSDFDVIVASNLFGDILTDIGGAIMGSIGIAPSANINVSGEFPSMFEPVHGSAPDIVGQNIANPVGQIWTAKLMLEHFGEIELGEQVLAAIEEATKNGYKTPDIGGAHSTTEVTDEICKQLVNQKQLNL